MSAGWSPYCKVSGAGSVGVGYSFTLALMNLDQLYGSGLGGPVPENRWPSVSASGAGGVARLGPSLFVGANGFVGNSKDPRYAATWWGAARLLDQAPEVIAAVEEWLSLLPDPCPMWWAHVLAAQLNPDLAEPGNSPAAYKCVGLVFDQWDETHTVEGGRYVGDTHWEVAGSVTISNLEMRLAVGDLDSARYTMPRSPSDRQANYCLFAVPVTNPDGTTNLAPTIGTVTLGGLSASHTVHLHPDDTGRLDQSQLTAGGGALAFVAQLHYELPGATDTSYAEVQNICCTQGLVPINLTCSFWSPEYDAISDQPHWVASRSCPEGNASNGYPYIWHCFNDGNTLKLQRARPWTYGGDHGRIYIDTMTVVQGPVRYNIEVGRFGHQTPDFPLPGSTDSTPDDPPSLGVGPGSFRVNVGLTQWVSETENRLVWLGPGLSDWYTNSHTSLALNPARLKTGQYEFYNCAPVIDDKWLVGSGELLTLQETDDEGVPSAPTIDNRRCFLALPSLQASPDTADPDWGPAVDYRHADISADLPPGQAIRPSPWLVGGVEAGHADPLRPLSPTFTITGGETLARALLSRKPLRFAYLCSWSQQTPPLPPYNPDWPAINCANFWGAGDTPDMLAQIPVEDIVNYDNSRLLQFSFLKCPAGIDPATLTLRLTHSHFDFQDECYTPENYGSTCRFGSDSDFPEGYERTRRTDDFRGSGKPSDEHAPEQGWTCTFDLAQLQRTNTVHLQHVDHLEIIGLPVGDYELADLRLIEDPDPIKFVDGQPLNTAYPHWTPQPAVSPWNWLTRGCGFASAYEGVPHLNVPNGTESSPFGEDVQWGIKGTQYRQWNPEWLAEQEDPPTVDPTSAWGLQRLAAVLGMQEQLTGSALNAAAIAAATADVYGNSLGFLYMWDLSRPTGDDGSGSAALRVGALLALGASAPLLPTTATIRWITHGRGQGMACENGKVTRGDGTSSDDASEGQAQFWRQPLGDDGQPTDDWQLCGSFTPDATGRFLTPPAPEKGYQYRTNRWQGGFVTTEYQYLYASFRKGRPVLGFAHHAVANALLVSDLGLATNGLPGHCKVQRGNLGLEWSRRFAMDDGGQYEWGNLVACSDRTEFALGDAADTYLRQANSLDGEWLGAFLTAGGYSQPHVIEAHGRFLQSATKDERAYLLTCAKAPPHEMIGLPVLIGDVDPDGGTCLAAVDLYGLLFAAVQSGEVTKLYSSTNRGAEWALQQQTAPLLYPYLSATEDGALWLIGYTATPTQGATGKVTAYQYNVIGATLSAAAVTADVGPADEGRPAIIERPVGGELIAVAPKTQDWEAQGPTPGLAEFLSTDGGQTWSPKEVHAVG